MALIKIEIISDAICPWCYIGYRNLQKALSLYRKTYPGGSKDIIEVWWKPYFIDQEPPKESILIQDRMLRRMDPKMVAAAQTRLKRVGTDVGIRFRFGGYIGSSRLAHQLLYLAAREGSELQCRVSELLFHYQFEEEADISQLDTVIAVGVQAGLREDAVREWLASGVGVAEMEVEAKKARADGVTGVPHFVIGGKHHVEGAVDMSELFDAFVAVREGQSS
ncbi:thioredoxin-like protein [Aspergillus transmontanensis]|uniref:Thioredoxin-like protein n=1 Tax=Aspergillus transmontanensis TaxID=1034304 RepID=A0A5N6W9P6_9EURO|nr:thioredoxin-like protein [Aspergillus transmontanensis]